MTDDAEPLPIKRLQEALINRIAAGEVIHRPASALKELLENSLDAGSTSIRVTVKDGGMKLLQIQDNGCGIRKADLPILAERFTTSKLSKFSDLSRLTTYGFRGEALASISHVAHLSVTTKTRTDTCAWKTHYTDGALVPPKPGQTPDPKPCAGTDGTIITIEDLFYNTPTRQSSLRSPSEEYARILDVMTKYAVHNPKVAIMCKKVGSSGPDLSTPSGSSTPLTIRQLYGPTIHKHLLELTVESEDHLKRRRSSNADAGHDAEFWSAEAHFTSANYQSKKMVFLLFINHRLVESPRMKRALEAVYSGVLPKGTSPFVYLSLEIDPRAVDVNVHPTKREVHFLNEDAIVERVSDALQAVLVGKSGERVFEYQALSAKTGETGKATKRKNVNEQETDDGNAKDGPSESSSTAVPDLKKTLSQHKVRTSIQDRTLDAMFPVTPHRKDDDSTPPSTKRSREIAQSDCALTSVKELRLAVEEGKHYQLTEIIQKHVFVGIVDVPRCLSLIQHSTKLYLINHAALAEELFYQLGLRQFGNFGRLRLEPPPLLRMMVAVAVDVEEKAEDSGMTKEQITDRIVDILVTRREMLADYFSLGITEDGFVESLPLLLRNYTPNLDKLPNFLMRLGPQVDWTSEKGCFETLLRELAYFYVPGPLPSMNEDEEQEKAERWQIEHVLFPCARQHLSPSKALLDRDVVQVANLPDLYRVFERC